MRDALKPYEGRRVIYSGIQKSAIPQEDGGWHTLLINVKIYGDLDTPIRDQQPVATIGHLWLQLEPDGLKQTEMLTRVGGVGTVSYYSRLDGSVDLSVKVERFLVVDEFFENITAAKGLKTKIKIGEQLIADAALADVTVISVNHNPTTAVDAMKEVLVQWRRELEINQRALKTGECKGHKPKPVNLFKQAKYGKPKKKGFAA